MVRLRPAALPVRAEAVEHSHLVELLQPHEPAAAGVEEHFAEVVGRQHVQPPHGAHDLQVPFGEAREQSIAVVA